MKGWSAERLPDPPANPGGAEPILRFNRIYRLRYCDIFERRASSGWRSAKRVFVTDHVASIVADPQLAPTLGASMRGA